MSFFLFIFSLLNLFISIVNSFIISNLADRISIIENDLQEFNSTSSESDSDLESESEESKIKLD
jgi:hypothetical protein